MALFLVVFIHLHFRLPFEKEIEGQMFRLFSLPWEAIPFFSKRLVLQVDWVWIALSLMFPFWGVYKETSHSLTSQVHWLLREVNHRYFILPLGIQYFSYEIALEEDHETVLVPFSTHWFLLYIADLALFALHFFWRYDPDHYPLSFKNYFKLYTELLWKQW